MLRKKTNGENFGVPSGVDENPQERKLQLAPANSMAAN
jgi:hypothetical protein